MNRSRGSKPPAHTRHRGRRQEPLTKLKLLSVCGVICVLIAFAFAAFCIPRAADDLNAVGIIVTAVGCGLLLWRHRHGRSSRWRYLWAVPVALLVALASVIFWPGHGAGEPLWQWAVPCSCLLAMGRSIRPRWPMIGGCVLMAFMSIFLSLHFACFVHTARYTGSPSREVFYASLDIAPRLKAARQRLRAVAWRDEVAHEAGWVRRSALEKHFGTDEASALEDLTVTLRVERVWNTFLTGMYVKERATVRLWYPGGLLKQAAEKVEFRVVGSGNRPGRCFFRPSVPESLGVVDG